MYSHLGMRVTLIAIFLAGIDLLEPAGAAFGISKQIVDHDGLLSDDAGSELCSHSSRRISRLSSIDALWDQFSANDEQICQNDYLGPLGRLREVLEASGRDACSLETVEKMHKFHWDHVVGTLKRSWRKASNESLPEPLKLFFLHFAQQTADNCQAKLDERLRQALGTAGPEQVESIYDGSLGFQMEALSVALVRKEAVWKQDDFFLIYDSMIGAERKKGVLIEGDLDEGTGERQLIVIKANNVTGPKEGQRRCREQFRPVYANTVLPVMKLLDMGFGNRGAKVEDPLTREWFEITQLCQLIIPAQFTDGTSASPNRELTEPETEPNSLAAPMAKPYIEVSPVHLDDSLDKAGDDYIVSQVKSGLKVRGRIYRKIFWTLLSTARIEFQRHAKSFLWGSPKSAKGAPADADSIAASLDSAERDLKEDENKEAEPEEKRRLFRWKRQARELTTNAKLAAVGKVAFIVILIIVIGFAVAAPFVFG